MAVISIIIPIYNVDKYIHRCVDSVLNQSFVDFDLILVDDGSPDLCGAICEQYAEKDVRIHVIHQDNAGPSAARNAGIDWAFAHSDSEWITFIDSDDWVHTEFLSMLYGAANDNNAEVSIAKYLITKGEPLPELHYTSVIMRDTQEVYTSDGIIGSVAWGKLYKKECFRDIRFPVGRLHEDEFVTYRILFRYNQIPVIDAPLYAYFQNDAGIIRRSWTPKRLDALDALEQQVEFFINNHLLNVAKVRFRSLTWNYLVAQEHILQCDSLSEQEKQGYINDLKKRLRALLSRYRKFRWISLWHRGLDIQVYASVNTGIGILYRIGKCVRHTIKRIPGASYVHGRIKRTSEWKRKAALLTTYVRQEKRSQTILLQTPLHGNLGDHAIAMAETAMLRGLDVSYMDFPWTMEMEKNCARFTPARQTILIHGGGFLGSLWPVEENRFRATLTAYRRNPVVVFPQTVYFDMRTPEGRECFEISKAVYEAHPNLTLFVREKYSYDFIKEYMPKVHVKLVPDAAMLLDTGIISEKRDGILLCLRGDSERTVTDEHRMRLVHLVKERYPRIKYTDTVVDSSIDLSKREQIVREKLSEFASVRLVITDRLHGMIFAAITETPCIVLDSFSHKVRGCYEWLKDLDYIQFVDDIETTPDVMKELETVVPKYNRKHIEKAMKPLYEAIRASIR